MDKIQKQFDELEVEANALETLKESQNFTRRFKEWRSSCISLLERAFGAESNTTREFVGQPELHLKTEHFCNLLPMFRAAKKDYENGGGMPMAKHDSQGSRWDGIIDHWGKVVGAALILAFLGWLVGFGQSRLSDAEKHDVWKQLRSDDGDEGFVHAVSKRVQADLTMEIKVLDQQIKQRKDELGALKLEIKDAAVSQQLVKLRTETKGFFVQIFHAIGPLNNAFNDWQINKADEGYLKDHKLKWEDFKRMVDEAFVNPKMLPDYSAGFE